MPQETTREETTQEETTQALAAFAASSSYQGIPERVREYCKDILLDTLACALAGHQGEETAQIAALCAQLAQSHESTVIGGERLSLTGAVMLNSYLITAVTMCDAHRPTLTHITPEVVPPALAVAERNSLTGRDLLVALAAGFEITTRVGLGSDYPAFRARGWHGPGVFGPFGSAAAVGRLLQFDADVMARAFGLAGSQAAGTFAAWGTPTVKFHQCRGALSGTLAALLAQQKFAATREFLTAPDGGLYRTYSNGGRPQDAIAGIGERWELEQIALRPWPSASSIQGMITAMFDLVEKNRIDPSAIRKVRIALSQSVFDLHGGFARYRAKFEALLSAHYVASVILHDRELTLAQFEPERYNDRELRKFVERIEVAADPALSGVQARVDVEMTAGTTLSARCDHPRGSPENRLSRAQIENKFRTYAADRLTRARIDDVVNAVFQLEQTASVCSLMDLLRQGGGMTERASIAAE
jgi:2-methylcitrate dehydratase PrpD